MGPPLKPRPEDIPYLRRLGWTVAIAAALLVAWRAADLLLLAFGSVIGAVLFRSAARLFAKAGVTSPKAALVLGVLVSLGLFGVVGWLLVVQFGNDVAAMIDNLPSIIASIEETMSVTPVGEAIVRAAEAAVAGSAIADRLGSLAAGAGEVLLNFLIVVVGALFLAANPRPYIRAAVLLTPPDGRPVVERTIDRMGRALRLWLKSKLISMTVMAILIGGALWLAGLENWAALGLLGGLSEFIPYVGPAVAMLPAIGLATAQGSDVLAYTLVAYVAVRVIEAWLVTPVVNRRVVDIPPALTLFTILGVGAVFGLYGVFFAGALLVVAFVGVREIYLRETLGEDIDGIPDGAGR
ncbi:AI-2E family transporter [Tsuneonella sp. YG55]|uniref:AI-2E family transporter n=1 Tax=Tsuneonella litorea TaxID=2976475 RepID=A0A9X3AMG2_9SPHN|nr:AI-2E family transporter [Tsuneonella litorea]MCT2558377.1 AI-2E family transporter [Tsuneonella litorea]